MHVYSHTELHSYTYGCMEDIISDFISETHMHFLMLGRNMKNIFIYVKMLLAYLMILSVAMELVKG